jgi:Brp/Blh family beta-carotene 15,15'-monooxygenase
MNFKKIAVFITLISLWLSNYFIEPSQQILAFFLIFSVGILHGSNDLAIINKLGSSKNVKQVVLLFGSYILTVLVAAGLFYKFPILALSAFILFSGYHFGEQHWSDISTLSPGIRTALYSSYGLTVLGLLFYLNGSETLSVIQMLTQKEYSESGFLIFLLFAAGFTVSIFTILLFRKRMDVSRLLFELFLFLVFAIVFKYATLIWAFSIYFIFWHSIPSILEQLQYLYSEVSVRSFRKYLKSSLFIWLISIGFIFLMLYLVRDDENLFIPLFFAFLGAITFAHSFIISKMFLTRK